MAAVALLQRDDPKPHAFRVHSGEFGEGESRLLWNDGAKPMALGTYSVNHVISPDGRTAVFGSQWSDRLRYVDLVDRRMTLGPRLTGFAGETSSCAATPHLWTRADRVVATGWCGDVHRTSATTLAIVGPEREASIRPIGWGPRLMTRDRAIFLASPPPGPLFEGSYAREERLGPARLIKVEPQGSIAQVVLRIRIGMKDSRTLKRFPGFAVRGDRAVVVSEDEGSAEIDLRTMHVRYHAVSFPARPQSLAPPELSHQGTTNPARDLSREAHWLDDWRIAVSGYDIWTNNHWDRKGGAGVWILDTRTWKAKRVDPDASDIHVAGETVLAWSVARSKRGLRAYDANGRLRFHRFPGRDVVVGRVRGTRATVHVYRGFDIREQMLTGVRTDSVDLRTGLSRGCGSSATCS